MIFKNSALNIFFAESILLDSLYSVFFLIVILQFEVQFTRALEASPEGCRPSPYRINAWLCCN